MEHGIKISIWKKIIWIYLFLVPIMDVFTSLSIHYLGGSMPIILGLKLFFLIYLMILTIRKSKSKIWYLFILGIYFILFAVLMYFSKGSASFFLEAQNLFRTFYFPLSLFFLYRAYEDDILHIRNEYLVIILGLYLFFLVVPELLHIGFNSYAHSKFGGLGWFYSTNEISGILAILGPFLIAYLKDKSWIIKIIGMCFYLLGIFVLGTKVPVLAFLIIVGLFFLSFFKTLIKNRAWKKVLATGLCSFVGFCGFGVLLLSSSFYENIKIHLDFLEIREVQDLFTFHHIDHFIFSERLTFLIGTHQDYNESSFPIKILGMGIVIYEEDKPVSRKMVEMDYFDIFYDYGIVGMILFFVPIFFLPLFRKYLLEEKISIFLILLLAFFSGHILVSPSVSVICALIMIPKMKEGKL